MSNTKYKSIEECIQQPLKWFPRSDKNIFILSLVKSQILLQNINNMVEKLFQHFWDTIVARVLDWFSASFITKVVNAKDMYQLDLFKNLMFCDLKEYVTYVD